MTDRTDLNPRLNFDDPDVTKQFITLRGDTCKKLFTGNRNSTNAAFTELLKIMEIDPSSENIQKAKKKWENLLTKYKKIKTPKSGSGTENGEDTKSTWAFFEHMDSVLKKDHNVNPPCLLSSSGPKTSTSSGTTNEDNIGVSSSDEGDFMLSPTSSSSAATPTPSRKKPRKLLSSPVKKSKQNKKSTLLSRMEKQEKKEDEAKDKLLAFIKKDQRLRRKEKKKEWQTEQGSFVIISCLDA